MASKRTRDHMTIRRWVEARRGKPAKVKTEGAGGILRIDFDPPDDGLVRIDWDEFFSIFDRQRLDFLHDDGKESRFSKFVSADDPA